MRVKVKTMMKMGKWQMGRGKKCRSEDLKDIDKITLSLWHRFSFWFTKLWQIWYSRNWEENHWSYKRQKMCWKNHFTSNPQNVLNDGRVSRHNTIRGTVGLKNAASKAKIEIDHFLLVITHEILADVLHYTNRKIDSLLAKLLADFNKYFKYSFVKEAS